MKKSQLVFVPCPGMGHLVSTVEFAKLLTHHYHQLSVTVIIIKLPFDPNVDAYINSITSSLSFPERLHFNILPPQHDLTSFHSVHPFSFLEHLIEEHIPNVKDVVSKLNSAPDSPPLAGIVVDMFSTNMIDVATQLGVPAFVFFTSGVAAIRFMLHMHTLWERDDEDITELTRKVDSGTEFNIPGYENNVPVSVFPAVMFDKEWALWFLNHAGRMKKVKGILANSFEELESHAVQSLSQSDLTVYPVGPILSVSKGPSHDHVIGWLDGQPSSSVLFLCFGSTGCFDDEDQVREIARALESSGVRFVWSLRKPPRKGRMEPPSDYSIGELGEVLPEGFLERTAEIGRVIGWAPQAQILAHEAVGGFVSHCGWNSILESIYFGVPIATWPHFAEQQLNAFQMARELKMSVEISLDYRKDVGSVISAERIKKKIRQLMEKDSEVRKKVKHASEMSKRALSEGGSSYSHMGRFVHDIQNRK